jgi:hypothetical protein
MVNTIKPPPLGDDDDDGWLRRLALSEEDVIAHYPMARGSYWRWFRSENVIDLVRVRRNRAKQRLVPPDPGPFARKI